MSRLMMSCLLVGVMSGTLMAYSGGTGEPNDPYQIATAEDLIALGNEPNDYNDCFILTADIDLSGYVFDRAVIAPDVDHLSYRFQGTAFTGIFNGQGHSIENLTLSGGSYLGLFGYVSGEAVLSNLILESVDVNGSGDYIGAFVGDLDYNSVIRFVEVHGTVIGCNFVGGLGGSASGGCVIGCIGNCSVSGDNYIGGLFGINGTLYGRDKLLCGGTLILGCCNMGCVHGDDGVGGLVGRSGEGGLGLNTNMGTVTGWYSVGGLVGRINKTDVVSSYNCGSVHGDHAVGGLVGENDGSNIISSYSCGWIVGDYNTGGLVGTCRYEAVVLDCFWDIEASGQEISEGGTGLTTSEMQDPNTYLSVGWDFAGETTNGIHNPWQMQEGEYPSFAVVIKPNGSGSLDDPFLITDVNELGGIWRQPLSCYRLETDIDLSGTTNAIPLIPWFGGIFDGNGFSVSHYHIDGADRLGFFGELFPESQVMNLRLESVDVNGIGDEIGALVGYNQGVVTSCYSSGRVQGDEVVGGLVGNNVGRVSSSVGACHVIGDKIVGGLVGENQGSISTSYSIGSVSARKRVGALSGGNSGDIQHCYSAAQLFTDASKGLIGSGRYGEVVACFWDAEAAGNDASGGWTTAEMQDINTYLDAGWDFVGETDNGTDDLWWMPESDYPRLWWEE